MTMPGFTAEAVFRRTPQTYRAIPQTTADIQTHIYVAQLNDWACIEFVNNIRSWNPSEPLAALNLYRNYLYQCFS